jgi:hypothetical protein
MRGLATTAAVAAALLLAGCGAEEESAPATVTETVRERVTVTEPPAEPAAECSTSGLRLTLPEQELPEPVADVRQRIFAAAVACDYDTLEEIALERGEGFTFTYGGGGSAAAHWRELEESGAEEPMRQLATILTLPSTRNESGSYAWPTAYDESPTDADWQALVDAGLLTQEQVDQMKAAGSYLGYRTAITADGDWQFFVAGD